MNKKAFLLPCFLLLGVISLTAQAFSTADNYLGVDDSANNGSSKVNVETQEENIDGKTYFTATMTGEVTTKFQYGFIQMIIGVTDSELEMLKNAKGFKFKCQGDGKKYRIKTEISNVRDYDHFGFIFTAPTKTKEYTVMFSDLKQEGWGKKTSFKTENIERLSIQTIGQPIKSVKVKIFDIEIIE